MAIDFPTSPSPGQQVTSGSRTWTWSGTYWANNTITGVQGTQGIQGTQGTQGTQGIQGLLGTQGSQGLQGIQGIQGITGAQGIQGIQGTQGTQGLQGIMGAQGAQGTQGTQGAQGIQGTQGTQGLQGIQGISGASILGTANTWTNTNAFTSVTATLQSQFSGSANSAIFTGSDPDQGFQMISTATGGRTYAVKVAGSASGNIPGAGLYFYDQTGTGIVMAFDTTKRVNIYNGLAVTGALSSTGMFSLTGGSLGQIAIFNSTNANGIYHTYQTNGTAIGDIGSSNQTMSGSSADFGITSRSGKLIFGTGSSIRAVIDSSGNVGIGTTSPLAKLQVSGGRSYLFSGDNYSVGLAQTAAQANYMYLGTASDGTFHISESGGTARFTLQQAGNVGIGTASPAYKLHLSGGSDTRIQIDATSTQGFYFTKAGTNNGTFRVDTDGNFEFYTKTVSQAMVLTAAGNVGIGTTSPGSSTKLFVNGQTTLKRLQKQVYNFYTTSGSSYVHFKTTLKLSGSGAHVGMWSWRFYGYSYGTARIIDSYFGLHADGSGNIYSPAYQDQGEFAFCTNMYKSSDNFLVIVGLIDNTYYFGLDVDIHHTMAYSYTELGISTHSQSANTSGVY
jgi:hypothetical protein